MQSKCDNSSVGRALASQAEGRGFESRLSLTVILFKYPKHIFLSRVMVDTIKHLGRVERVTNHVVTVRILQASACSGCSAAKLCQSSETKEKYVDIRTPKFQQYEVGQEVMIEGSVKQGLRATLWAYVVPLALVVLVLVIAVCTGVNDAFAAFCSLGVLVVYYIIMYIMRKSFEKKFAFQIVKTN